MVPSKEGSSRKVFTRYAEVPQRNHKFHNRYIVFVYCSINLSELPRSALGVLRSKTPPKDGRAALIRVPCRPQTPGRLALNAGTRPRGFCVPCRPRTPGGLTLSVGARPRGYAFPV